MGYEYSGNFLDSSTKRIGTSRKLFQLVAVDTLRLIVMGDQTDISFLFPRLETGDVAAVQRFQHLRVAMVLTDAVQQFQEVSVILPVYGLKLDGAIFRLLQRAAGEEIGVS